MEPSIKLTQDMIEAVLTEVARSQSHCTVNCVSTENHWVQETWALRTTVTS